MKWWAIPKTVNYTPPKPIPFNREQMEKEIEVMRKEILNRYYHYEHNTSTQHR
jgi:hypothetical protein